MLRSLRRLACVLPLAVAAACGSDGPTVSPMPDGVQFAPALNVDLATMTRTPSGLYVKELAAGEGTPAARGQWVAMAYTGWLVDGTQFDAKPANDPLEFQLGVGQVIRGWDEGIAGMRIGGRRQLVIPPGLAYGAQGSGARIPPNAALVFLVERVPRP